MPNAAQVEFTAGYGAAEQAAADEGVEIDAAAYVPELVKAAIKLRVQHLYDGDEAAATAAAALLDQLRVWRIR